MLPAIAVLHGRHRAVRDSGAVLATIAGTSAVAVGLAGSINVDLQPAAIFVVGMWWWTMGKMWAETAVMPRMFGLVTAALGVAALGGGLFAAVNVGLSAVRPGFPDVAVWPALQAALGAWLIVLGLSLPRGDAAVPSR
jgi:hypothetical protein